MEAKPVSNKFNFRSILAVLVLLCATVFLLNRTATVPVSASGGLVSVTVELRGDPGAVYKAKAQKAGQTISNDALQAYRDQLKAAQDQFIKDAQNAGVNAQIASVAVPDFNGNTAATVQYRYTLVYNGVNLHIPESAIPTIQSLPEVKAVHMNHSLHIALSAAVPYIHAPQVYGKHEDLTPFDTIQGDGYEGQGMYLAVLDTGVDWTNPMFGGDPTPPRLGVAPPTAAVNTNQKVVYYLPLTAGALDDFGHGSHVSGDAAGYLAVAPGPDKIPGTADDVKLHGVAPQARLMEYKVCAGIGQCLAESTMLALEDAVSPVSLTMQPKPIANVINMSLGGAGSPDDPTAVAADNAALAGTIVVAAAGNSGPGDSTVGSPAAGRHVIAAAATTHPGAGVNTADVTDGSRPGMIANLMDGSPAVLTDITNNYVFCGLAEKPTDCPSSVSGKIALIQRGSTFTTPTLPAAGSLGTGLFTTKAANAAAAGAVAALIYNNIDDELSATTVRKSAIPTLGLSKANGEYLLSILGSNASGAVSAKKVRINHTLTFSPSIADFSSRGPVQGLGQIKPDVAAPGVNIYSATARVGGAETNTATMFDPSGFIVGSGTSFACPLTAGAATLIKQAHLDWTPDMVRTVLINTATNLRDGNGTPKADGLTADRIMDQGGGLIDVYRAINARTLMGVSGDGITNPSILGSYSFGAVPVINSRVTHTETVTVMMQDVSGQGGTYNLSVANNRELQKNGITATVSNQSVTVPANGTATFTVNATVDGNIIRDTSTPLQMQWYVVAQGANAQDNLHMPFYMRLTPTEPAGGAASDPINQTGTITVGDGGAQAVGGGVSYQDYTFTSDPSALSLTADLNFPSTVDGVAPDLDLFLIGPDGTTVITQSANPGGPEHLSSLIAGNTQYTLRVSGFIAAQTDYTLTGSISKGGAAPALQPITAQWIDPQTNTPVSFDGNFNLQWQPSGSAQQFEVEQSTDGTNYQVLSDLDGGTISTALQNLPDGHYYYRVRSLTPGKIGSYVTIPSNVQSVIVSHRMKVDITNQVQTAMTNVSFVGGVFSLDLNLKNNSTTTYLPLVELNVINITSTSGTVSVKNADNSGNGKTATTPALFSYTNLLGSDQQFTPAEITGNRTMQFNDSAAEMFSFDVQVTAFQGGAPGAAGSSSTSSSSGTSAGSTSGTSPQSLPGIMRITVNPLTKAVTAKLL
ncbi:MAG: minor extracellular serine protease Vpr [Acidobacteriota bacterium]|jgi:minor extracellular serine protease Vpr|nr:minor extracellular serine protease Vpr [Acidobacteriota bacterium]